MNRNLIILIAVIAAGSIVAIAYATNTTITNTSVSTTTVNTSDLVASHDVNTTNLFVNGQQVTSGGSKSQIVKYTGNGTLSRIIPLSFTPKHVTIIQLVDLTGNYETWVGDINSGFCQMVEGSSFDVISNTARPGNFPFVANGFDVGHAHAETGHSNILNSNYVLIAFG